MTENSTNNIFVGKIIINLACFYITLPFVIFVIGWFKWYYALIVTSAVIFTLICAMRNSDSIWVPEMNKINTGKIIVILLIVSTIVCISGIGNLVWQNTDHEYRNAIFRILVEDKWPAINYEWNKNGSGLIYYIGFWLPAALVGKITNITIGYYFQVVWALIGILIMYYLICAWQKKILIWPVILFLLFSGLDIVGYIAFHTGFESLRLTSHIEWWAYSYQYSSFITQLFWVFNQAIPIWVITMLLFLQHNSKNLIFLLALSMLSSTLPFIGLIPVVIYFAITKSGVDFKNINKSNVLHKLIGILKELCSIQNILGGGIIGILSFLYLKGNLAGQYIENTVNDLNNTNLIIKFLVYFVFCFFEAGIYLLFIYKYQKRNGLFYLVSISLYLIPLIRVGTSADFCMRASIPSLFLLLLLIIDTIFQAKNIKDYKTIITLSIILMIGSITPILEINRTVFNTYTSVIENGKIENAEVGRKEVYTGLNFSGNVEDNIFFKKLVK